MPCDAVATARASIDLDLPENLKSILSQKEMITVVETILTKKYGQTNVSSWAGTNGSRVIEAFIEGVAYSIAIDRDGSIEVFSRSPIYGSGELQKFADDMTVMVNEYLKKTAGVILQGQVKKAVSRFARITEDQQVKGARVLKFEF